MFKPFVCFHTMSQPRIARPDSLIIWHCMQFMHIFDYFLYELMHSNTYMKSSHLILKARNLSMVSHPEISIESYAGYFTVNKEYNSNLFFWFFPAKENPNDAPVLLWLQGSNIYMNNILFVSFEYIK